MNAKEMFLRYGGSRFQMSREGVLRQYEAFGITKEQEMDWRLEAIRDFLESDHGHDDSGISFNNVCFLGELISDQMIMEELVLLPVRKYSTGHLSWVTASFEYARTLYNDRTVNQKTVLRWRDKAVIGLSGLKASADVIAKTEKIRNTPEKVTSYLERMIAQWEELPYVR